MHSMTGYGQCILSREGRELTLELKTVNHRFLDISVRAPRALQFAEEELKRTIGAFLTRGHVDANLQYRNTRADARVVTADKALLEQYQALFNDLGELGIDNSLSADTLLRLPDVISVSPAPEDAEAVLLLLREAAEACCQQVVFMRQAEGARLAKDMQEKVQRISALAEEISSLSAGMVPAFAARLKARMEELLGQHAEEARLLQEAALYADRVSVDEELVRLRTHLAAFLEGVQKSGECGRRLDFLLQEMNREANTIGSKVMEANVQAKVVDIKCELEKLREQVQNIE